MGRCLKNARSEGNRSRCTRQEQVVETCSCLLFLLLY